MTHILALVCGVLVLGMAGVNGAVMLVSPRSWFRLPRWLQGNARFTTHDASTFGGSLVIRLLGAVVVSFVLLIVVDLLLPPR